MRRGWCKGKGVVGGGDSVGWVHSVKWEGGQCETWVHGVSGGGNSVRWAHGVRWEGGQCEMGAWCEWEGTL